MLLGTWLVSHRRGLTSTSSHRLVRLDLTPITDEKIFKLCSNEKTRKLRAVQNRAFIQVPFSASTLGVRIGALAYNLAEAFTAIVQGEALPSLQFTATSIADDGSDSSPQVLAKSGIRVFDSLPMWNGTNLNDLCPGSNTGVQLREDIPLASSEELAAQVEKLAAEKVILEDTVNDANVKVSDLKQVNEALEVIVDDVSVEKGLLEKEVEELNARIEGMETMSSASVRSFGLTTISLLLMAF